MRESIRTASLQTKKTKAKAKNDYIQDTQQFQEKFRDQTRIQQENISIIRDQYRKVQEIYKRKTSDMKERLENETKKADTLDSRRKLELEGYSSDLQNMQRKINFYQKYITKLKSLVEEDRGVADLFGQIRNNESDMDDLEEIKEDVDGERQMNIVDGQIRDDEM